MAADVRCCVLLQVTFADTLGAAKHQEEDSEVTSKNEAKKLAFYLFWNIKPSFNRSALLYIFSTVTIHSPLSLLAANVPCCCPTSLNATLVVGVHLVGVH